MRVKIRSIADKGVNNKERLVLRVLTDTDVGNYAVFASGFYDGQVTIEVRDAYWFPDKPVKSGDLVVLYSKAGKSKERVNKDGSKTHFFYWNLNKSVWLDNTVPVVTEIKEWTYIEP